MHRYILLLFCFIIIAGCKKNTEKTHPLSESITESAYASGTVKSKNQYKLFSTVNGTIEKIFVVEGDTVHKGQPILSISGETIKLSRENAALAAEFSDFKNNTDKLKELMLNIEFAKNKMQNDSLMLMRQRDLFSKQVGTKIELEQKELIYQNSKNNLESAIIKYNDLERQLKLISSQSKNNLMISSRQENDFVIKSDIDGIVYDLTLEEGELVTPQTPLGTIGKANSFILEMQVDEYDILRIKSGQRVIVSMDIYKGEVFDAVVDKVYPYMNDRSKSFLAEATFTNPPKQLYPNVTFEANIIIAIKEKALTIPRNYLLNDSTVLGSNGDKIIITTGLKDYKKIEVLSGLTEQDEIIKPVE